MPNTAIFALDLTQRPPRSVRTRLGGYVILPRMIDKGRAEIAGMLAKLSLTREDISGWAGMLDLDDYVTFGGKP